MPTAPKRSGEHDTDDDVHLEWARRQLMDVRPRLRPPMDEHELNTYLEAISESPESLSVIHNGVS